MKSLLLIALVASTASANTFYRFSGHACVARDPSDGNKWWYDSTGAHNNASAADDVRYVWCPVTGWQSASPDLESAQVFYYDGSSFYAVQCQVFVTTNTGTVYSSGVKYSCATDPVNGCSTPEVFKTGYGSIRWAAAELPYSGYPITNVGPYGIFCSVPPQRHEYTYKDANGWTSIQLVTEAYSRLLSYVVEQVAP